jgi:hypothetical protein
MIAVSSAGLMNFSHTWAFLGQHLVSDHSCQILMMAIESIHSLDIRFNL